MDTRRMTVDSRYLKTPDGAVYGPVDALTLCAWAADARVTPGCQVSSDGRTWKDATEYAELRLNWQASLPDGTTVGPLNLFALWELIQDGSLPRGLPVRHRLTGEEVPLDERLLPVALKESRDLIQILATQLAGAQPAAPTPDVESLKARLAQAEKDLADNLRLMGETQRLVLARDRQIKALEERVATAAGRPAPGAPAGETEALRARLSQADRERNEALRRAGEVDRLAADRARRIQELEKVVGQGEARLTALQRAIEADRAGGAAAPQPLAAEAVEAAARLAAADHDVAAARQERDAAQQAAAESAREAQALKASLAESAERLAAEQRETASCRTAGDAALRGVSDELARARADAAALREAHDQAAAAWQVEHAALKRQCGEAEALARTHAEAVAVTEARAHAVALQLQAALAAAQEQQTEWERRLAEAGQATQALQAEAARRQAQAQAERQVLDQRLEAAERAHEALTAACAGLRAGLAAVTAEKEQAGSRIAELESAAQQAMAEREAARQHLAGVEQAGREALAREAAARTTAEAEAAAGRDRCTEYEAALERLTGGKAEAEAALSQERGALQTRVNELEKILAAAQSETAACEARLTEQAEANMAALVAASQNEAGLRERFSRLEREQEQTIRRLGETKAEATALRQSLSDERSRSAEMAKRLQVELKGVQRDLHAMNMVKLVARQIRTDKPTAAAGSTIDWLSVGSTPEPAATTANEPEDKFAGLDLYDQVGVLHEELKSSIGAKELLRLDLEKLRKAHDDLRRRGEDTERDLGAKVTQLQNEIQSSGAVLHQTMEELERREAGWRLARKKAEEREKELAERIAALEAELAKKAAARDVIHGEWESPPKVAPPPPSTGDSAPIAPAVLENVEAQLQTELHKWDSINRDKDRKADKTRNWFRWKQP